MAKAKIAYVCGECGAEYSKWQGQCGECGAWNALSQIVLEIPECSLQALSDSPETAGKELRLAAALDKKMKSLLGRSLRLRQVSAGGCGACEADINVLGTIGWDLGRFGIQYAASPRHADGVLITGPVTKGMELALQKTWEAVPEPRIAIALGAVAISRHRDRDRQVARRVDQLGAADGGDEDVVVVQPDPAVLLQDYWLELSGAR